MNEFPKPSFDPAMLGLPSSKRGIWMATTGRELFTYVIFAIDAILGPKPLINDEHLTTQAETLLTPTGDMDIEYQHMRQISLLLRRASILACRSPLEALEGKSVLDFLQAMKDELAAHIDLEQFSGGYIESTRESGSPMASWLDNTLDFAYESCLNMSYRAVANHPLQHLKKSRTGISTLRTMRSAMAQRTFETNVVTPLATADFGVIGNNNFLPSAPDYELTTQVGLGLEPNTSAYRWKLSTDDRPQLVPRLHPDIVSALKRTMITAGRSTHNYRPGIGEDATSTGCPVRHSHPAYPATGIDATVRLVVRAADQVLAKAREIETGLGL